MSAVEGAILLVLQSIRFAGLTQLMAFISALGNAAIVWIVIGLVLLAFSERRQAGLVIFASLIVTAIVCELVLAHVFGRVRPCDAQIGVTAVVGVSRAGWSFPCFAAACGAATTVVIALMVGRAQALPAGVLTLLISFSRLFLGVNYPTDVFAGLVLGAVIGAVLAWLFNTLIGSFLQEKLGGSLRAKRKSVGSGKHSRY